jgi:hypothetical protein
LSLAERIPVLKNNPVFVLEARRIWRPDTAFLAAALVVFIAAASYVLVVRLPMRAPILRRSGYGLTLMNLMVEVLPEAAAGVWLESALSADERRSLRGQGLRLTVLDYAYSILWACAMILAKYIVPALMALTVGRRTEKADADVAATPLTPRTVVSGIYWAAAWPAIALTAIAIPVALIATSLHGENVSFPRPESGLYVAAAVLGCTTVGLLTAIALRRTYGGVVAGVGAAWGLDAALNIGGILALQCDVSWLQPGDFGWARLLIAAGAFTLACRLWRRMAAPG